ncbi:hypothetical protein TanjilG_23798 [Lupinus angustifolius]|uniref:protein SIEVE ELEMENT OCCLUSION B-like n=1 Tax=Lupinus angustifolius TaxID=3871 RepID=UPI00090DF5C4|nr:PREDICTED: protein SIEVE ELEMENT OCCLUSION B-like [Lupinus angustifolius]OIV90685.1 hypothetical protein TanjilG_23798 [Lupinus angustifolius]
MAAENENNPLTLSDEQILGQIYSTHVHSDSKFDAGTLFTLVENVITCSTYIVDNVVQGTQGNIDRACHPIPQDNFSSPLCTLKQISSELSCKPPGEENAHKTTLTILKKLSTYSWDAKAVLTLAAFAIEYGEFWLLSQQESTDLRAKSLAIIKRVPTLTKPSALQKHRNSILEVNNLIKIILKVIELIFELGKLASTHNTKDVPALIPALEQIPVDVYWTIITVAAIVTQIDSLTLDKDTRQELAPFAHKINIILNKLRKQISLTIPQIAEEKYLNTLRKYFQTPTEIFVTLKFLIFGENAPKVPIYDSAAKTQVSIRVVRNKEIFLFFSTLDITESDFDQLIPIYNKIKTGDQYKILWVPIVEEWNDELRIQFESLKSKMPWYVLQHFEPIRGIRFIKEELQFTNKPTIVVLSPQTKILHLNAFYMIEIWGLSGFPFTQTIQESLTLESSWIHSLVTDINPHIPQWFKEQKYIFFYGGKDNEWIQRFNTFASTLASDSTLKQANISIELFYVETETVGGNRFWKGVESLFITNVDKTTNSVTQEVQKLFSYKNESGWALLTHGSTVLLTGHGTTMLKTVSEFDNWKKLVIKIGFEISFKEHYEKVILSTHICSHIEIPKITGKIPDFIECPECHRKMEVFVSYKCCHIEEEKIATNA